jgi:hypothetical protein
MSAAEAFHIIERQAGSWDEAGAMMTEWALANQPQTVSTYNVTLSDLQLFADAACELDAYKDTLAAKPAERARIMEMLERVHDTVERAAGGDANLIYCPDDSHLVCVEEGAAL